MAIDTPTKRRSALLEGIFPVPDGTIGAADRQQAIWYYAGILAVNPVAGPFRVVEGDVFSTGGVASDLFSNGGVEGDVFSTGGVAGDTRS